MGLPYMKAWLFIYLVCEYHHIIHILGQAVGQQRASKTVQWLCTFFHLVKSLPNTARVRGKAVW